jgi:type I restriction enzyme S subunit
MNSKPLDKVAKIIAGQSPASSTYNSTGDGLPFFQGKTDFQEMHPKVRMWCTSTKRKVAEPGDILISVRAPVGSVNICNQKSIIGRGLSAIRPSSSLNDLFLYYFLKANERQIDALGTGSTFKAITQETLKKIEIPLPPLDVQKRIAHLLGKVEGLIARRKHHLQQLDDLLKSVFLKMFGDPVRNEKKHNISTLAPYITHLTSGGRGWATYYSDSGKRFIRSLDVQMNAIGSDDVVYVTPPNNKETERTRVIPGDVLLTITGSKIGRVCFVPQGFEEAYISQHVAIIRTKGINPVYLSFYLSMPACGQRIIAKQQYGQAKPGLNLTQIQNFEIIDPDLDLPHQFAALVEKVESLKSRYQHSMADLETLYGALSQKAFKGELDLSRVVLPVETSTNATGFTTVVPPQKSQQHQHTKAEATP